MPTAPAPVHAQSAVIPYRIRDGRVEVLLVTTRSRGPGYWIVPKGHVEPHLGPARSAEKEAFEEAGARGTLSEQPFGHYHHGRGLTTTRVDVFLLHVDTELAEWPEEGERRRRWVPADVAARIVGVKGLGLLLGLVATTLAPPASGQPAVGDAEASAHTPDDTAANDGATAPTETPEETPEDVPAWPPPTAG